VKKKESKEMKAEKKNGEIENDNMKAMK